MNPQPNTPASLNEAVADPFAYPPYCLHCEKEGHRTKECWSTHCVTPRSNEIDTLAAPGAAIDARTPVQLHELAKLHGAYTTAANLGVEITFQLPDLVTFVAALASREEAPVANAQDTRCPDCLGSEFPGWKRGIKCATCKGSATVEAIPSEALSPATVAQPVEWLPTPANINALPAAVRGYIHDLSTNCDPSGMVRQNTMLRDTNAALQKMYRSAADALAEVCGCFDMAESEGLSVALSETTDERLKDLVERRLMHANLAAQPCASQGCGGAVLPNLVRQLLATCDIDDGTTGLVKEVRAALSTAPRSLDGATPGGNDHG